MKNLHPETIRELSRQDYQYQKLLRYNDNPKVCIMAKVPNIDEPFYYFHIQQCKFHQKVKASSI